MKHLLTIAGSDSSGGAGIQADLKTFAALGTYGMSCICALTAQNTEEVRRVADIEPEMITAQLEAIYDDIPPDAVKTGMLSVPQTVDAVSDFLSVHRDAPLVVDPVMVSTSGAVLLTEDAVSRIKEKLIPLASVITPNMPEAEILTDRSVKTIREMEEAARRLCEMGCASALVKGGHLKDNAMDILYDGKQIYRIPGKKIMTKNTHGTGCTISSAIAVMLVRGFSLEEAAEKSKRYVTGAIQRADSDPVGHGHGPLHHFWFYEKWGQME